MASRKEVLDYLLTKLSALEGLQTRKMFGEYAIYYNGKLVATLADDQLFVKLSKAGTGYWGEHLLAAPYPGAKEQMLIPEEDWEDALRLCQLIRISEPEIKKRK